MVSGSVVSDSLRPYGRLGSSVHGLLLASYCSGLPFPSPGHLPNPGIEPRSPALQVVSLPTEPPGKPLGSDKFHLDKDLQVVRVYTVMRNPGVFH